MVIEAPRGSLDFSKPSEEGGRGGVVLKSFLGNSAIPIFLAFLLEAVSEMLLRG